MAAAHEELDRGDSVAEFANSRGEWQQQHQQRYQGVGRHNPTFSGSVEEQRSVGGEELAAANTAIYDRTSTVSGWEIMGWFWALKHLNGIHFDGNELSGFFLSQLF